MEFTYRISEADYVQAAKMARKSQGQLIYKRILFWLFIVLCLVLLFSVIAKQNHAHEPVDADRVPLATPVPTAVLVRSLAVNIGPGVLILGVWVSLFIFFIPYQTRRLYRRDTNIQGEMSVVADTNSISIQSSAGTSFQSPWNNFKDWREANGLILLRFPSTANQIINAKGLSEVEREEFRGILKSALPRRR